MLLIIDNYDSFTYNVSRYFVELGQQVKVCLHDQITIAEIEQLNPQYIVISPGPCTPNEAGISLEVIQHFAGKIPLLGICLGHQCIVQHFGGKVIKAKKAIHGKTSVLTHDNSALFADLESSFKVTRYHSLVAEQKSLPDCLKVTAWTSLEENNKKNIDEALIEEPLIEEPLIEEIMAIEHKTMPIYGVQYHPEAVLTEHGHAVLKNFLQRSIL